MRRDDAVASEGGGVMALRTISGNDDVVLDVAWPVWDVEWQWDDSILGSYEVAPWTWRQAWAWRLSPTRWRYALASWIYPGEIDEGYDW